MNSEEESGRLWKHLKSSAQKEREEDISISQKSLSIEHTY